MATVRRVPSSQLSNFLFRQHINGPTTFHLSNIIKMLYEPQTPNFRYFVAEKKNTIFIIWRALNTRDAWFISLFIHFVLTNENWRKTSQIENTLLIIIIDKQKRCYFWRKKHKTNFPTKCSPLKLKEKLFFLILRLVENWIWFTFGFLLNINLERLAC